MSENAENNQNLETMIDDREKVIVRTSFIGIGANLLLAAMKAVIGILSNSIAVVLDAVNNLSDALSSVITIIGAKLAGRLPDKKHPLGHGRVEYLSALIVSAIVLYAGISSLVESVKKMIQPAKPDYSVISLLIIASAVVVKLLLGRYVKGQGEKVNSGALVASGQDAASDAVLSLSVLICALIYMITNISLEAYVGAIIAVFIIKAGYEMMQETLDDILGHRADPELTGEIRRILNEEPEVRGAYDMFLNNYGPGKDYCSVHLELPDTMTVEQVDNLTRRVQAKVFSKTGVIMSAVGVYSFNTKNDEAAAIRNQVMEKVLAHEWALQVHGFHADMPNREIRFDVVFSFDIKPEEGLKIICEEMQEMLPEYKFKITPDVDLAD